MLQWPFKDPDEFLDYGMDWSARVGTDKLVASLWDVPDGLVGSGVTGAGAGAGVARGTADVTFAGAGAGSRPLRTSGGNLSALAINAATCHI